MKTVVPTQYNKQARQQVLDFLFSPELKVSISAESWLKSVKEDKSSSW